MTTDVIKIDANQIGTMTVNPPTESEIPNYAEVIATEARKKWGDNLVRPSLDPIEGMIVQPYDWANVPLRLIKCYSFIECKWFYRLDAMGYPDSAVIR